MGAFRDIFRGVRGCSCMSAEFDSRWFWCKPTPMPRLKASLHLRRQGFTIYLPRHLKQRRHARRIEKVAAPLFPRYLFVSIAFATQRWLSIDLTFWGHKIGPRWRPPGASSTTYHRCLKTSRRCRRICSIGSSTAVSPGDKIWVVTGAFSDCAGLYEAMTNRERVAVLIELLGRKVRVVLDNEIVEAA